MKWDKIEGKKASSCFDYSWIIRGIIQTCPILEKSFNCT